MSQHEHFMAMALKAARNPGLVEPNPQVGVVIAKGGEVMATGRHEYFGGPHAEVNALRKAGHKARGATLYATLEPCCAYGKTPPCTDAIIAAGIAHVVVGAPDPTQGRASLLLRRAGVRVTEGVLQDEAIRLVAPFYKLSLCREPYVIAKWAMSLDGKLATRTGDSRWISCPESRRRVHRLRSVVDGVLVGLGTVLADDPMLTPRLEDFGERVSARRLALLAKAARLGKPPFYRIVLDSRARIPLRSRLVETAQKVKTVIAVTSDAPARRCRLLERKGCEIVRCRGAKGRVEVHDLLRELGRRRLTNILVEGGGTVLGAFFDAGAVDQVMAFIAPKIIGGGRSPKPFEGTGAARVLDALTLKALRMETSGDDVLVEGYVRDGVDYLSGSQANWRRVRDSNPR